MKIKFTLFLFSLLFSIQAFAGRVITVDITNDEIIERINVAGATYQAQMTASYIARVPVEDLVIDVTTRKAVFTMTDTATDAEVLAVINHFDPSLVSVVYD